MDEVQRDCNLLDISQNDLHGIKMKFNVHLGQTKIHMGPNKVLLISSSICTSHWKGLCVCVCVSLIAFTKPAYMYQVEHIIREQNIWAAYEILELFCEFVLARVPILESQR